MKEDEDKDKTYGVSHLKSAEYSNVDLSALHSQSLKRMRTSITRNAENVNSDK
jgi:hypothetical protein